MPSRSAGLFPLALSAALLAPLPTLAAEPRALGEPDCRIAPLEQVPPNGAVSWKGDCRDGHASGKGVLSWRSDKFDKYSIEATLVRGEVAGEALLKTPAYTYTGTLKSGVPHGQGFFEYTNDKGWYEGQVAAGCAHGKGIRLDVDRSRYAGEWVNGERNGLGEATFSTGGSYSGHWKNDKFHGQGKIVYAGSGRTYEGVFEDGRVAGLAPPETAEGRYAIREANTGSRIRREAVVAGLPPGARWKDLTEAQKNKMRANYPALEAGDDPPYPVDGQGPLVEMIRRVNGNLGVELGFLGVNVLVDKNGKAATVTTYGEPSKELVRAVSHLVVMQAYKPALCRGAPCEMVYPLRLSFSTGF